ncbi:MAG: hypothetical protein IJX99_02625 [Clostridia bacterium]|nr:hypothetical protein [Clostridia bacterium]
MINKDIFKIWAPVDAKWVDWVRPVPFISIDDELKTYESFNFVIPNVNYIEEKSVDTAWFVDLPSYDSVAEGLALASKFGFRPIPIYNGTNEQQGAMANVNNQTIEVALVWGAYVLLKLKLEKDALPVFLLDSNRMNRYKMSPSVFDNSWDIYHQDIPSAEYFLNNGIKKIVVRGKEKIEKDLSKIFYGFQKKGIKFFFTDGYSEPKEVVIKKPKRDDD